MKRLLSTFGIVFTGAITKKYNDPKADNAHQEGHFAWRTKGLGGEPIKPEPVWIETFDDQRAFVREQKLVSPSEIGPAEVHSDGKGVSTRGLPGAW